MGAEARLGSARAYLVETLATIYAQADAAAPIDLTDRAPRAARLHQRDPWRSRGCRLAYKAAGVDAIFPGSPFERRFRDIHTFSQQIQARSAHFQQVGQILLGVPPPEEFL